MNHIYFTALRDGAGLAAELAAGDGSPRVYMVEPPGSDQRGNSLKSQRVGFGRSSGSTWNIP
jgi:hypothetical protein